MAKIEQFSRLINHGLSTSGQAFTIPTSNDHTDETWLATDLYIGEVGINITDDTIFMRTNNGVVQIATGTSSGSTASGDIWSFDTPDIVIGSTYSADSVSPYSGYYTDLGTSALRWKNIYLGGSGTGYATINTNAGLNLTDATDGIISTNGAITGNHPIELNVDSSNSNKDRVLWLNTRRGSATGSTNYLSALNCDTVVFSNNSKCFAVAGTTITFDDSVSNVVHLGVSKGKTNYNSEEIIVGGQLAVRGVTDDGTTQYNKSDWTTSQSLLRTSDALTTSIVTIPWSSTASGGDVIQVKAYIMGTDIADATKVYSSEIMGCYSIDSSLALTEVGTPILDAISSYVGTQPDCEISSDGDGVYVQVTGVGTDTIQWLCSYSYHRLINVTP